MIRLLLALLFALALAAPALAAPALKGDITVNADIVTVGDMFDNPGELAETAIFRAPAPGTTGIVPLADVQRAAHAIGLDDFDNVGFMRVRVVRLATPVDAGMLSGLVSAELARRGVTSDAITADIHFDQPGLNFNAAQQANPAVLTDLRYAPETGLFSARFTIAGIDRPVDLTGRADLMTMAPRLTDTLAAGTILSSADFELVPVPVKTANAGGYADLDQLVGKQLVRQSRSGMMLKPADVSEPTVVTRNDLVTVTLKAGPMTLTVKGQALSTVAAGENVDVLNTVTKKILHGVARADGTVEIVTSTAVASL
ncbi:MAG TPA: flagellar basal body P-ring formation chaperone FlgA [Devosia sp.]|nr:flagellar basal body P-ring formation chaperone FlgA [Devosia sp.]